MKQKVTKKGKASEKMLKESKRTEPDKTTVKIHDQHYRFFKKNRETLGSLYKEHAELRFKIIT